MKVLFAYLCLFPLLSYGQEEYYNQPSRKTPLTIVDMRGKQRPYGRDFDSGYQTSIPGWVIKNGDTLSMGKGSLPNKDFAFLYEQGGPMTRDYRMIRMYMPSSYTGLNVIVKDIGASGTKKTGFSAYVVIGVGTLTRYYVELENAIEAGEILPPKQYRKASTSTSSAPVSVADELIKLKQLLDAGGLTQQEYDTQKKKLLNQ